MEDPFTIFKTELKDYINNQELLIATISRLSTLSDAMGKEKTISELIPFLSKIFINSEIIDSDENEGISLEKYLSSHLQFNTEVCYHITLELSNSAFLSKILDLEFYAEIIRILAYFASYEETLLREESVNGLVRVLQNVDSREVTFIKNWYVNLISQLIGDTNVENTKSINNLVVPSQSWFATKCAAAALIPHVYIKLYNIIDSEDKNNHEYIPSILELLSKNYFLSVLCNNNTDDTIPPMVRHVAFSNLPLLIPFLSVDVITSTVYKLLLGLLEDGYDVSRLLAVACIPPFMKKVVGTLPNNSLTGGRNGASLTSSLLVSISQDASWRVRQRLAKEIPNLFEAAVSSNDSNSQQITKMNEEKKSSNLLTPTPHHSPATYSPNLNPNINIVTQLQNIFSSVLLDSETEVRSSANSILGECGKYFDIPSAKKNLLPGLDFLSNETIPSVKISFSENLIKCFTHLCGSKSDIKNLVVEHLFPLLIKLLKDDDYEVRIHIIDTFDKLSDFVGINQVLESFLPIVLENATESRWRIRLAVVKRMSSIALKTDNDFFNSDIFENNIRRVLLEALSDPVYSVRVSACEQIVELLAHAGKDQNWAIKKLIHPTIRLHETSTNYLHRMIPFILTLLMIKTPTKIYNVAALIEEHLLPTIIHATLNDCVLNVKIYCTKVIHDLASKNILSTELIQTKLLPCLDELKQQLSPDNDLDYFCNEALIACNNRVNAVEQIETKHDI